MLRNLANEQQKQLYQQAASAGAVAAVAATGVGGMAGVYDKLGLFNPAGLGVGVGAGWGNMSAWYNMANSLAAAGVPPIVPGVGVGVGGLVGVLNGGDAAPVRSQLGNTQLTSNTTPLSLMTPLTSPSGIKLETGALQTPVDWAQTLSNPLSAGSKISSDEEDNEPTGTRELLFKHTHL